MNPFELFLHLKPEIEASPATMTNLRWYANRQFGLLEELPAGDHNQHYRIGKVGDIWLATRERTGHIGSYTPEVEQHFYEGYIIDAIAENNRGIRVPRLCGGVKVDTQDPELVRYFLVVEDLTQGGSLLFTKIDKWRSAFGGTVILHDLDEESAAPPLASELEYMVDSKMIKLVE